MTAADRFSLEGRVALVTGASSGIGAAVAQALAGAGAKTVLAARRTDRLAELKSAIDHAGGQALAVAMDVTDPDSVTAALDTAEAAFGTIDLLVNNAGVGGAKPFLQTDAADRDFIMGTNFDGVWTVAQSVARRMVEANCPGSIINIASVLGLGGKGGYTAYCASKGAVVQLTRAMALDLWRHDIRVNAIAPGWFVTEINEGYLTSEAGQAYLDRSPAKRAGKLDELIGPILLLASPAGSFINGAILPVDGGHTASLI